MKINFSEDLLIRPVNEYPEFKIIINTLAFDSIDEALIYAESIKENQKDV